MSENFHLTGSFTFRCVDLRTVSYEVPPQEMLSRDSVTVSVDAVCFYKVNTYVIEAYRLDTVTMLFGACK